MSPQISRRTALIGLASASWGTRAQGAEGEALELRSSSLRFEGEGAPASQLWTLGGREPGRLMRARVGESFGLSLTNKLDQTTALH